MRWWTTGLMIVTLAAGVAGCGGPDAVESSTPAPLAVSGDERLVVLKLPGMT